MLCSPPRMLWCCARGPQAHPVTLRSSRRGRGLGKRDFTGMGNSTGLSRLRVGTPPLRRVMRWRWTCCAICSAGLRTSVGNASYPVRACTTSTCFSAIPDGAKNWHGSASRCVRGDPAAVISKAALAGTCELCAQALDLFVSLYGAEAGNLALKLMAIGGIFIGGGIAPKIIPKLKESTFMKAFVVKGRMQALLEEIPVRVILNDKTALLGAARYAALQGLCP